MTVLPRPQLRIQLFEYVNDHFRKGMGIIMDGSKLEPLMIDAGFVDVSVKKIKIEVGTWGSSNFLRKLA